MKKTIIVVGIMLVLAVRVMAVSFSPSSLIFELQPNQKQCKTITLGSESETINVSDRWAENKDIEWKISLFDKDASYHGISIEHPQELSIDEREVEVCLSGSKIGEYHGVILLREEQQGNSVIQMGIWLKVIISEQPQQPSSESSGGGSSGSLMIKTTPTSSATKTPIQTNQETKNPENENSGITGAVVGENKNGNSKLVIIFIAVILVMGIMLYLKSGKKYE